MFTQIPTYNRYRVLVDRSPKPLIAGEDVFALQCGINFVNDNAALKTDGVCGPKTGAAIWKAQTKLNVVSDGKAGQVTDKAIATSILGAYASREAYNLALGQVEHESSFLLGNYSEQRPDGSYDAGVCQENIAHNDPAEAFNPVQAIAKLIAYTRTAYDSYVDNTKFVGEDHSEYRRWTLAAGHWNAPAYANWLAGLTHDTAKPSDGARATLEMYMSEVTLYL